MESAAVVKLRQELDALGGSARCGSLSIKVKWGQGELAQIGSFRQFLAKYPEVFALDGTDVRLINHSPSAQAKGGAAVPADNVGGCAGKSIGKVGGKPMTPAPRKRGWGGDDDEMPDAKVPHLAQDEPMEGKGGLVAPPRPKMAGAPMVAGKAATKGPMPPSEPPPTATDDEKPPWAKVARGKGGMIRPPGDGKGGGCEKGGPKGGDDMSVQPPAFGFGPKGGKGVAVEAPMKGAGGFMGKGAADEHPGFAQQQPPPDNTFRSAWEQDALQDADLPQAITESKVAGIDFEITSLSRRIASTDDHKRTCQRLVALLRSAVSAQFSSRKGAPPPTVEVYGAHAQGTELDGSDFDVMLRLDPSFSQEDRERNIRELRERLERPPLKDMLVAHDGLHLYPHAPAPLSVEFKATQGTKQQWAMAHIILGEKSSGSTDRRPSVDEVIKKLCDTADCARDLVRLVKLWATNHGLARYYDGFMNGVAWSLLALFFLQKAKLVPPFSAVAGGNAAPESSSAPPLAQVLRGFFEFLAGRGQSPLRGMSVVTGEDFPSPSAGPQSPPPGPLFLQDPAEFHATEQQQNLAETMQPQQWAKVLEEAKKAADRLNARPQRWFHWAEILDPRQVPADKIQRLQSLQQAVAEVAQAQGGCGGCGPLSTPSGDGKGSDGKGASFDGQMGFDGKADGKGGCEKGWYDGKGKGDFDANGKGDFDSNGCFDGKAAFGKADSKGKFDGKGDGKGKFDGKGANGFFDGQGAMGDSADDAAFGEKLDSNFGGKASFGKDAKGKWSGKAGKDEKGGWDGKSGKGKRW